MKKEEYIKTYGKAAYEKMVQQHRDWKVQHPTYNKRYHAQHREENIASAMKWREANSEEVKVYDKKWRDANPNKVKAKSQEQCRKGGKRYVKTLEYNRTGLQGERGHIRVKHGCQYRPFKQIIAPESQIHHEWIPGTANYTGVALVEKDQHMHGYVDVIKILEGKITLLTEEEIAEQVVG